MGKPILLDLFCGAGGCSRGYADAGFDVMGVDVHPQRDYPYAFIQDDAVDFLIRHGEEFAAIHASPPCQAYSVMKHHAKVKVDLVGGVRKELRRSKVAYVIENVVGSPLVNPCLLCGTMFGLRVKRHRLFETSFPVHVDMGCNHPPRGSFGHANRDRNKKAGDWISVAGSTQVSVAGPAMGIDWIRNREVLSQAIPPAYTKWIGERLMKHLKGK